MKMPTSEHAMSMNDERRRLGYCELAMYCVSMMLPIIICPLPPSICALT